MLPKAISIINTFELKRTERAGSDATRLAGEEGFEPPWTVLETVILPLYDSPKYRKRL